MSVTAPERRRIAVIGRDGRVDLAVPAGGVIGDALRAVGFDMEPGRVVVLERNGDELALDSSTDVLVDGAVYTVVDLRTRVASRSRSASAGFGRPDHGAAWWMLAAAAVVAATLVLAAGAEPLDPLVRLSVAALLVLLAAVAAVVQSRRVREGLRGAAALAPLPILAFVGGFLAVPPGLERGGLLASASGLLAAGVLAALVTATAPAATLRAAAGTSTAVLLVLAGLWGAALLVGWGVHEAALVSVGAVPLGLRALPSTLVNVPEGYHLDYARFMTQRWTVRGAVPSSPESIRAELVRRIVEASSARLSAGTVLLAVVAAVLAPVAFATPFPDDPVVTGGAIALLALLLLALLLTPRHTTGRLLRWAPRVAAAFVVLVAVAFAAARLETSFAPLVAALLLVAGLVVAATVVPVGRGARSLVWSRIADVIEWLAVACSLPAALLAADVLGLLRGMMAG